MTRPVDEVQHRPRFFASAGATLLPLLTLAGVLTIWQIAVKAFDVPSFILPAPTAVWTEGVAHIGPLLQNTAVTAYESVLGLLIAAAIAIPLAILIVYSATLESMIYPVIVASNGIPKIAIAPLFLIWLGYGLTPKIAIAALIAFFPMVVATVTGLRSVDPEIIRMCRSMGAPTRKVFVKIRIPAATANIFAGLKVAASVAVVGAVVGEFIGSNAGLGYYMLRQLQEFNTALVFADLVLMSAMGVALFYIVAAIERLVFRTWHVGQNRAADAEIGV
jgi:NitT/TauT family transport system permease protein